MHLFVVIATHTESTHATMPESPHTIKSSTIERQSLEYEDTMHSTKYQDSLRRHTQATWHAVRLQLWKRCDEC